jgi:hypothetical protein
MSERRGKYNARPVDFEGYHFDSQAEARRYQDLVLLVMAKEISKIGRASCRERVSMFV